MDRYSRPQIDLLASNQAPRIKIETTPHTQAPSGSSQSNSALDHGHSVPVTLSVEPEKSSNHQPPSLEIETQVTTRGFESSAAALGRFENAAPHSQSRLGEKAAKYFPSDDGEIEVLLTGTVCDSYTGCDIMYWKVAFGDTISRIMDTDSLNLAVQLYKENHAAATVPNLPFPPIGAQSAFASIVPSVVHSIARRPASPLAAVVTSVLNTRTMAATRPSNLAAPMQPMVAAPHATAAASALTEGALLMSGTRPSPSAGAPLQPVAASLHAGLGMQLATGATSLLTGMPFTPNNPVLHLTDEQKQKYSQMQFRRKEDLRQYFDAYGTIDFLPAEGFVFLYPDSYDGNVKLIAGQEEVYRATFHFGVNIKLGDFRAYRQALLALQMARDYIRDNNIGFATDITKVGTGWRPRITIQRQGYQNRMQISPWLPSLNQAGLTIVIMKDWLLRLLQQGIQEESLSDDTIQKLFRNVVQAVQEMYAMENED